MAYYKFSASVFTVNIHLSIILHSSSMDIFEANSKFHLKKKKLETFLMPNRNVLCHTSISIILFYIFQQLDPTNIL